MEHEQFGMDTIIDLQNNRLVATPTVNIVNWICTYPLNITLIKSFVVFSNTSSFVELGPKTASNANF